jgi:uncharacterized protein YkwD
MGRPVKSTLVAVVAALTALLLTAAGASAQACAGANAMPGKHNAAKIRTATMCLLNRERAKAGMGRLSSNAKLRRAARSHSVDMVSRGYFDHSGPAGDTLLTRVDDVNYIKATASYFLAENIAWGSGSLATPAQIVKAWMNSPGHRENILTARFKEAGIGIALGTPSDASLAGATYTMDFGRIG